MAPPVKLRHVDQGLDRLPEAPNGAGLQKQAIYAQAVRRMELCVPASRQTSLQAQASPSAAI